MFRALNFILISLLSWSTFAQQPIAQAKAYLSNHVFEEILFVSIKEQKLYHIKDDKIVKDYIISSSAYGTGNEEGSNKTPLGLHKVKQKYGEKTPINGRMVGRIFYGEIATIYTDGSKSKTDDVTSRIFWLEGLEKGKNKGDGIDSYKRYIYIHGTSEEGRLGSPSSHGCIRMKNKEVIALYRLIEVGTLVLIL
jgi:lipoprotein-anchoring transpeptidase ErfK/SrfK